LIVADSSPLISLAHLGRLEILGSLYERIFIPGEVQREIAAHPEGLGGAIPSWIRVQRVGDQSVVADLQRLVDRGEAEAIQLAIELETGVLIDERRGRRLAQSMGVSLIGTLGVLLLAQEASLIDLEEVLQALEDLDAFGFRMSSSLRSDVAEQAKLQK
jgi:predicted nucleic acid-binding protein